MDNLSVIVSKFPLPITFGFLDTTSHGTTLKMRSNLYQDLLKKEFPIANGRSRGLAFDRVGGPRKGHGGDRGFDRRPGGAT